MAPRSGSADCHRRATALVVAHGGRASGVAPETAWTRRGVRECLSAWTGVVRCRRCAVIDNPRSAPLTRDGRVRIVIATTVLLSFISFWRAAAIVLNDMGSTAFYIGGIVEQALGKSAPWFILGVMVFSYIVRAVYIESSAMFVRGGVYRVVKEAMGGTLAKLSVSALLFDYVLTGPISGVSAGQYIVGLLNELFHRAGSPLSLPVNATAAVVAI